MDAIALQTLHQEMREDCRVALQAFATAGARFERQEEVAYEGCAYHLCRMYNAIEQMGLRVAKVFENNIADEQGWHSTLLQRLTLRIDGLRPALLPAELKPALQELKAFRHVFVDAFELHLDPDKLSLLLKYARQVADRLSELVEDLIRNVAQEQQIHGKT